MFMNFMINDREDNFDTLKIHVWDNNKSCNNMKCITLSRVSIIRYLGLIFDKNLRWNLHVNNLVMRLGTITYNFYKLRIAVPTNTSCLNSVFDIISSVITIWTTYLGRTLC